MTNFESELPIWQAEGIRPPDNMLIEGWKASQKPPADYFNWFFSRTHFALKELQEKAATEKNLDLHKIRIDNPHKVTSAQVGLSNVINQKQATKVEFDTHDTDAIRHITSSERSNWNSKANGIHSHSWGDIQNVPIGSLTQLGVIRLVDSVSSTDRTKAATPNSVKDAYDRGTQAIADASTVQKNLESHSQSKNNPHAVTANQVGLGKVSNFDVATTEEAIEGTSNSKYVTPFTVSEAIKALQAVKSVNGKTGSVVLGKSDIGLGNVDNVQQASKTEFNIHASNNDKHITAQERIDWNSKANLSSNVDSATKLLNSRQINGVAFDGTKDITILADPCTTEIPKYADLNDYTKPGNYSCKLNDTVNTLLNCPVKMAFALEVKSHAGTSQTLITYVVSKWEKLTRNYYPNGGWGNWIREPVSNGDVQANLVAEKATKLLTPRNIAGISFDGTASITIPAGNVGAYTKEEMDTKTSNIQADLTSHANDKSNPHNVTAAQIDAVTTSSSQTITGDKNFTGTLKIGGIKIVDLIYPIGAIYQSTKNTEPSTLFGGTWVRIKGKVLVGLDEGDSAFNTSGKTGGNKNQELRALIGATDGDVASLGYTVAGAVVGRETNAIRVVGKTGSTGTVNFNHSTPVRTPQNGHASTLQPYETVYIWKRTA